MKEIHIHEVLRMMQRTQKRYNSREDFVEDIAEQFGEDTLFFSCSNQYMRIDDAYDFLMNKEKITIDSDNKISIKDGMTMCNEEHHH